MGGKEVLGQNEGTNTKFVSLSFRPPQIPCKLPFSYGVIFKLRGASRSLSEARYLSTSVPDSSAASRQQLSRYSNQTTDSTTNESQINSTQGQFFFSPKQPERHCGPPHVGLFPGDKAAGGGGAAVDHSISFNTELLPPLLIRLHDVALKTSHTSIFFLDQKVVQ